MAILDNSNDDGCHRAAFILDLTGKIAQWQEQVDPIVLMLDAYEDICTRAV